MTIAGISLIIFAICIILFIIDKLPMSATAILGCVLMVIFGVCDFKTAFGQFASSTVILTIGVMIIGAAIAETGLSKIIGNWIVKISKGNETVLIIATYLVSAAMSMFLTNSAVLAVFIPIIMGLSKDNTNIKAKNLIMPIAIGCVIGGASTLVGSTQQMTAQGLLEDAGLRTFKTFDFTLVGGMLIAAGLIYCLTIGKLIAKKIWKTDDVDYQIEEKKDETKIPKYKPILMAVIFCLTVVFYITEWVPIAITSTCAALLCICCGLIKQKKAFTMVNWDIVGRLGGCLGIAKAIEVSGGSKLIADFFLDTIGSNLNPYLLFCILVLLVLVISEFISNSTAIMIVLPILIFISGDMGLNAYAYALGITLAAGVALSCPLASSTLGISMSAGYKFNDYFKHNFVLDIISYAIIIIFVPLIYGLV